MNNEREAFQRYYASLCEQLPTAVEELLPHLVASNVISFQEEEDIVSHPTSLSKARAILIPIRKALFEGISRPFHEFLRVMKLSRHAGCAAIARKVLLELKIHGIDKTSDDIQRTGNAVATCKTYMSDQMSKYHQYLKCKYESLELISIDEQLDCSSSKYVTLTLLKVDGQGNTTSTESRKGDNVTLSEALDVQTEKKKMVLIKGDPGMGKSTLSINICKCWAEGSLLQDYNAVILLPLRDPEIQEAKTIGDLLLIPDEELRDNIVKEIVNCFGENICFILEGYDELPQQVLVSNFSLFAKLKEKLPNSTLVYTSRPEACNRLEDSASRIIEIKGFNKESIDEYISNTFETVNGGKELAAKLKVQLQRHSIVRDTLQIPINVAIVCLIFFHFSMLPETLTQLYTFLCLRLILRHIITRTSNKGQVQILRSLDDLPGDISEQFMQLCLLAYKGIQGGKIIFSSVYLFDVGISDQEMSTLGLLMVAPRLSVYGRDKSYNFLHKTLQEFCAAWHISKLSLQNQLKCLNEYWNCDNWAVVWRFYSGITRLNHKEVLDCMLPCKMVKSFLFHKGKQNLIDCVFEAQSYEVCQKVGSYLDGEINITSSTATAVSYFFVQYKGKIETITLNISDHDDIGCQLLTKALLKNTSQRNNIRCIDVSIIQSTAHWSTQQFLLCMFQLLEHYSVAEFHCESIKILAQSKGSTNKECLQLAGIKLLSRMFTVSNTLRVLNISQTYIGPEGAAFFAELRNVQLHKIDISLCNLGPTGADKVGEMLHHNNSIISVDLQWNDIGDNGVEKLVRHLYCNNKLQHLYLGTNNITVVGASQLGRLIASDNSTVITIELSNNPLRDEGVHIILSSLKITMEHIGMILVRMSSLFQDIIAAALHKTKSFSFIPPPSCECISKSIASSAILQQLELDHVSENVNNMIMSAVIQNNNISKLKVTYSTNNWISGIRQLLENSKSLKQLSIVTWGQMPQDIIVMADYLKVNTSIERFKYCSCGLRGSQRLLMAATVLQFLEQIKQVHTMKIITFRLPAEASKNHKFLWDVEKSVKQINYTRSTNSVSNLTVKIRNTHH